MHFLIQFIENQGPLHVSSITCSSSGDAKQTALGILRAYNVAVKLQSWHRQLTLYARNIPSSVCVKPPEDEQVMLETCRGPWSSINWMKSASPLLSSFWYTMIHSQKNIKLLLAASFGDPKFDSRSRKPNQIYMFVLLHELCSGKIFLLHWSDCHRSSPNVLCKVCRWLCLYLVPILKY
jgi:hypothetical protein